MRLTDRGWALLLALCVIAGCIIGTVITLGDSPCGYAVTTVVCE